MLSNIIWWVAALYIVSVTVFIVLENRNPKSTLAWLLAFYIMPVIGLLIYLFLGRNWKAFSHEKKLAQSALSDDLIARLRTRASNPYAVAQRVKEEKPESYNEKLMRLVRENSFSGITARNEVDILQDTDAFYPSLLQDLRGAQHHIHMFYFIWSNDPFTQQVKEVLIERAQAGVEVRALYDAMSRRSIGKEYMAEMRAGGVQMMPYMAFNSLRTLHNANYRGHRKMTVVDGKVGYLGGMNLDREQMPGTLWPRWRDTQIRIHGGGALALQGLFVAMWHATTDEHFDDETYFPSVDDVTELLPVQVVAGGPDSQFKSLRQMIFQMIVSANTICYIQSPCFIPDETILEAMKSAALAGVDVRMICTPRGAKYQMPYRAALTYFKDVAAAGVKVYLYDGGYFHAKTIAIDSAICTIGSCNMNTRSYNLDYEVNAVLYDAAKTRELEAQFMDDMAHSTPFDAAAYAELPVWRRFADSVWRLASPVM